MKFCAHTANVKPKGWASWPTWARVLWVAWLALYVGVFLAYLDLRGWWIIAFGCVTLGNLAVLIALAHAGDRRREPDPRRG